MKEVIIKGKLKNEGIEVATVTYDLIGKKGNDILEYNENDELHTKVIITKKENIIELIRENQEALITFYFDKEKKSIGIYHLKEEKVNFDMDIYTDLLEYNKDDMHIKYHLEIEKENIGTFDLNITWRGK